MKVFAHLNCTLFEDYEYHKNETKLFQLKLLTEEKENIKHYTNNYSFCVGTELGKTDFLK